MTGPSASMRQPPAGAILALLLLAYIFNFLDRQILGILAPARSRPTSSSATPIRGVIGGLAFALLYAVLGVPLAYLADRTSRSTVIAGALAVWSAFTALCGIARIILAAVPFPNGRRDWRGRRSRAILRAASPIIFRPQRRARALAIYSLGVPLGLAGGTLIGAYLASWIDWRAAFLVMGVAGLLLAPIVKYFVRDLPRSAPASGAVPLMQVFPLVARKPTFWLMAFAASMSSLCGYGLALWTPSVLIRSFHLNLIETGNFFASLLLIGGCTGRVRRAAGLPIASECWTAAGTQSFRRSPG